MPVIKLLDWMADFDNAELPEYERKAQLLESVRSYNEEYQTFFNPEQSYERYQRALREEKYGDR